MEELLKNTRNAVEKFSLQQAAGDRLKNSKAILQCLLSIRKFIEENEKEDRGIAQRFARELSEVLAVLPAFANFADDKKLLNSIHTKKQAEDHLDRIQSELENSVKEQEESRRKRIRDWVRSHQVFGKLLKCASKKWPDGTYVLLFRRSAKRAPKQRKDRKNLSALSQSRPELSQMEVGESNIGESNNTSHFQTAVALAEAPLPEQAGLEALTPSCTEDSQPELETILPESQDLAPSAEAEEKTELKKSIAAESLQREPELVTRPAPDGKVFTRFRTKEFSDETKIYRLYRMGAPVVGACIISNGKLEAEMGILPQAPEGGDKLRYLLAISREAVGKPGKNFIASQHVLNELFQMAKSREMDKDMYVLLFQEAETAESKQTDEQAKVDPLEDPEPLSSELPEAEPSGEEAPELSLREESEAETEGASIADSSCQMENEMGYSEPQDQDGLELDAERLESLSLIESGHDAPRQVEISTLEETQELEDEFVESESDEMEGDTDALSYRQAENLQLISKMTEDGRIITRYRHFDFNDSRSLFEGFRKRKPVLGAAVIKDRELIRAIGILPLPLEGEKLIDVLLRHSQGALDKPSIDFIASNEILQKLYDFATGEHKNSDFSVVLFAETDGRYGVFSLTDKKGRKHPKSALSEFRIPRVLHERFKNGPVLLGASIISSPVISSESSREVRYDRNQKRAGKGGRDERERDSSRSRQQQKPSTVIAAFGRTPLKQNVLLSPEVLKRLGVDLSIL